MKTLLSCRLHQKDPDFEMVTEAVGKVILFLKEHGVTDPGILQEVELICAEALNNAVEHGCGPAGERYFSIEIFLGPEELTIMVDDPSPKCIGALHADLPEDPLSEGGRGFFLIREMSDSFEESRPEGHHRLRISKNLGASATDYCPGSEAAIMDQMTGELLSSYEMINTLLGLGEWLATAPDIDTFMKGALERVCQILGADLAYVRFEEAGVLRRVHSWGKGRKEAPMTIPVRHPGIEGVTFREGQERTITGENEVAGEDPLSGLFSHGAVTPVFFKQKRSGLLVVGRNNAGEFFDAGQLKVARTVAEYLGITAAMETLQRQRAEEERSLRDLEIAAGIQLSLMPGEFDSIKNFDVYGICRPALRAGGDYFDLIPFGGNRLYAVVADVMGKGLSAALLATMLRSNLRTILRSGPQDPALLLTEVNRVMADDLTKLGMFITLSCGCFEADKNTLTVSSAAHHTGFLQSAQGHVQSVDEAGVPLGVFPEADYPSVALPFHPGDRFLFYTDGIAEALSKDETFFGTEGIARILTEAFSWSSRETVQSLLESVDRFVENEEPSDDRTVLLLSRQH